MIPLWDDIDLPPNYTLRDINALEPESLRLEMQGRALELAGITVLDPEEAREFDPNEAMLAVIDSDGNIVGIELILDVEDV